MEEPINTEITTAGWTAIVLPENRLSHGYLIQAGLNYTDYAFQISNTSTGTKVFTIHPNMSIGISARAGERSDGTTVFYAKAATTTMTIEVMPVISK